MVGLVEKSLLLRSIHLYFVMETLNARTSCGIPTAPL